MSLMGIDVGTSGCKAVAFTPSGRVLARAVREYTPEFPAPGLVEMDPEVLWEAARSASRAVASQVGRDRVQALAFSVHGETFVPTNGRGEAIGAALLNADNRATAEAEWWERTLGRERIFRITGQPVHPMYSIAKIEWMRRHQPERFASARRFLSVDAYLLTKLGLPPYVDFSLASRFMAFDVRSRRWSEEILSAAGLTPDRLPLPAPAATPAGKLSRTQAAELGLESGALVAVGGHDQPCGALGMGAVAAGRATDSMGSYECLAVTSDRPALDEAALAANLNSCCHVAPERYLTMAYFPSGLMVKWFCDNFCGEDAAEARRRQMDVYSYLEELAPEGPTGLLVLPHLIGSGNPHFDPRASGAVVGLLPMTSRYHLYRGILEGLACELANLVELIAPRAGPLDPIRVTGGGARSRLGLRLRAAIAGKQMQRLENPEAACLGAGLLAGVGAGVFKDLGEAVDQAVRPAETIEPEPELAAAYADQLRRYRLLYPALAPLREA
jgi:xylulokinase